MSSQTVQLFSSSLGPFSNHLNLIAPSHKLHMCPCIAALLSVPLFANPRTTTTLSLPQPRMSEPSQTSKNLDNYCIMLNPTTSTKSKIHSNHVNCQWISNRKKLNRRGLILVYTWIYPFQFVPQCSGRLGCHIVLPLQFRRLRWFQGLVRGAGCYWNSVWVLVIKTYSLRSGT